MTLKNLLKEDHVENSSESFVLKVICKCKLAKQTSCVMLLLALILYSTQTQFICINKILHS